ncbi:MAG: TonB-dependent receptor [Candidatus Aminicenantes bacterium]|nr:TonB-dependent receptor [Candidatus Aminicenantes bacterium]
MTRKILAALVLSAAALVLCLPSSAAGPTGAIKGRVVDMQSKPLAGAYLYVTSPTMLGITNSITSKTGRFDVIGLTPGRFTVLVEMPGFKTVAVENIVVAAGATATLDLKLEPSELEDETIGGRPGPTLDRESARLAIVMDSDLLSRLPLKRDFTAILDLVPGLVFEGDAPGTRVSVNGLPVTTNAFVQDGVNVTHPEDERAMSRINVDLIDQVVVETAGHAAETGPAQGAYVNVIHRPGGSSFQGSLAYTNASKGLAKSLWSAEEIAGMGGAPPPSLQREHDFSLTLGGPILEDISWLFANFRYRAQSRKAPFRYWTDPLGVRHFVYDLTDHDRSSMFKFSIGALDKFKGVLEFSFSNIDQPVFEEDVDRLRPEAATRRLEGEGDFIGRGGFSYNVSQSTRVSLGIGYSKYKQPLLLNETASVKPQYYDVISGYSWGSGSMNDREAASRMRADVSITRLLDNFLGMPHELVAGGEYETVYTTSSAWKADNLIYNYASGSPYTYGRTLSPTSGEDVGWGLIGFWIAPGQEGALSVRRELKRLGFFAQDTMRIGGRLSLSAGLRFDRSEARFPGITKGASGNEISSALGNLIISPQLGYNLYGQFNLGAWEKPITWNSFSPRAVLSFDVLGNGMTILKGSYARIPEYLGLGYSRDLAPLDPLASHDFIWYDENGDGGVSANDAFILMPYDFRVYASEFFRQAVDPDLTAPVTEEWTAGLEQELLRDFTLSARYISRRQTNAIGHVLYDPSTEAHWWRADDAPQGWWVPFSTVVPGTDGYADVPVTLSLRSTTAPDFFERIENVPELTAKYRSLELSFRKRMSHNWQLFGSFAWNRSTGTTSVASRWSAGNSPVLLTPNAFINIASTDRLLQDRPLVARLAGTVRFRWDIYLSFLFKAQSGSPWARTVTVIPPAGWAGANGADITPVTVYLENPGSRRFGSWKNLDFRLEKEFKKADRVLFSASVDVFNALGEKYKTLDLNDGGTWAPTGEGDGPGTRVLSGTYGTYLPLWGTRAIRFNISLKF